MTIRQRTILIIGTTLLTLTVILYLYAHQILIHTFAHLEEQYLLQEMAHVNNGLDDMYANLHTFTRDWAAWDDSYNFAQDPNEDYIETNLTRETYAGADLNLVVFLDQTGQIVYGRDFDTGTGRFLPLADETVEALTAEPPAQRTQADSGFAGLMMLSGDPMLVSFQPIMTSENEGPVQGTLIMGRRLDEQIVDRLARLTGLVLSFFPLESFQLPDDELILQDLLSEEPSHIQVISDDEIAAYGMIEDAFGQPAVIFRVDESRDIFAQGMVTLALFLVSLVGLSLAFTIVVLVLIERSVLRRLHAISQVVDQVRTSGDLSTRIPVQGQDELATLAANVQNLFSTVGDYQGKLRLANEHLEEQVLQRTQELADTIARLEEEIAARELMQSQLSLAHEQALHAVEIKSQILANISHDSRTPLSVIVLRVEMLKRGHYGQLTDKQQDILDGVLANTHELLGFINNLLQGSKLDTQGDIVPNTTEITPTTWLANLVQSIKPLADQKGLQLDTEVAPEVPATLYVDADWLKHIASNLANNAIKFTSDGAVSIKLLKTTPDQWALQVTDTGPGIPQDAQAHIFDAFWQLDGSSTRTVNRGVGLGLSIVQQLVRRMGGSVTVDSVPGEGSVFTVHLPLETSLNASA